MTDRSQDPPAPRGPNRVGVRLRNVGFVGSYDGGHLALSSGDAVLVETEHGHGLGTVTMLPAPLTPPDRDTRLPRVIKRADARDLDRDDRNQVREREALRTCLQRVRDRNLRMKMLKAEQAFDAGKITFYFYSEGRVDFRELVRELAHELHTRIEMKQIGARDEAKLIGAVGPCGRELCCSTFLHAPGGVSVKMARAQGLSLNPSKLAGMCGRLKCCLRYEYDTYLELGRALPSIGTAVVSVKGEGIVTRQNILRQTVTIRQEDGVEAEATLEDLVQKKAQ